MLSNFFINCRCVEGHNCPTFDCIDINECNTGAHNCPSGTTCINTEGSFRCCNSQYVTSESECESPLCSRRSTPCYDGVGSMDCVCVSDDNNITTDDDDTDINVNECPKGQFTDGNFTCQDCPLNTYNNIDGTTQTSCIPCPENHITHSEGSTSVAECKRKHSVDP